VVNTSKSALLNEAYHFDSFVVGPSNSLAQAAAYAVSQGLGTVYNPLFIYGPTGLGKTHLLHAIGNEALRQNPSTIVRYETADRFMHDFINSIRFDKSHAFRDRYKKVNLLLVDDVQFFSNKNKLSSHQIPFPKR
jgi:chromosomal replication initiator protein